MGRKQVSQVYLLKGGYLRERQGFNMLTQSMTDLYGHSNALADTEGLEVALALRRHVFDPF